MNKRAFLKNLTAIGLFPTTLNALFTIKQKEHVTSSFIKVKINGLIRYIPIA